MKILKKEHADLEKLFISFGLKKGEFLLSKKAGWVRIMIKGQDIHFAYHHKKRTIIEDNHFILKVDYYVRNQHQESKVGEWKEVLDQLSSRLRNDSIIGR